MEFVTLTILATLLLVVILQIIILSNQTKNANVLKELTTQKLKPHYERDRSRDRKDSNHRQHRKNQYDSRTKSSSPQTAPPSGSVDNVEKSLRDINLKLKNVERDQEVARRKIQGNIGKDSSSRRDNRGRRDRNNRNNWKNKNNQDRSSGKNNRQSNSPNKEVNSHDRSTEKKEGHPPQATSLPDLTPMDFDTDNTQHGRKFMVKRRMLKDENPTTGPIENEKETMEATFDPSVSTVKSDITSEASKNVTEQNDTEISFGRR